MLVLFSKYCICGIYTTKQALLKMVMAIMPDVSVLEMEVYKLMVMDTVATCLHFIIYSPCQG